MIGVAEQSKWEVEFLGKGAVLFDRVKADAEDFGVFVGVLLDSVTESNAFGRSAGRVGFRVKPQHDPAARVIAQADVFARVGFDRKIRRLVSDI